jgi:uncharacterized phiE125 gp8 family phage protein
MTLCPLALDIEALPSNSPSELLDLDLVKAHCAIDDDDFDAQLDVYIRAAVEWAEGQMHRTIYSRTHQWVLKTFPYDRWQGIRLPRGKTQSVTSIVYYSSGAHTLTGPSSGSPAGTDWQESLIGDGGGWLLPPQGGSWPSVDCDVPAPVTITFEAGWLANELPADITHALLFAISDAFEFRGSDDFTLQSAGSNLSAREALISPYKLVRWY